MAFDDEAVILSLSKLNIKLEKFFLEKLLMLVCYFRMRLSIGQMTVILSLSELSFKSNNFFYKSFQFGMLFQNVT